jgi:hypothetical protein
MTTRARRGLFVATMGMILGAAGVNPASGGDLMPSNAKPKGYSLADIAVATAVYNTGQMVGNPLTPPPPDVPFLVLVGNVTVPPGTMVYLPVFVADNSPPPVTPKFPMSISNQAADAMFLNTVLSTGYGLTDLIVEVDGQITILDDSYIVGVKTAPLLDGGGTSYIVAGAFLTPFPPGHHNVSIGGIIKGHPVVFLSYDVVVSK